MMINFEQIIRLMKKTGEKFIFNHRDENFILLSLNDYEKLLDAENNIKPISDLTEDELVDKINREIAQWRTTQSEEVDPESFFSENNEQNQTEQIEDDQYYLEPVD